MEPSFWHQRWVNNEIGFHEGEANARLVRHFAALRLPPGSRVFVPLCGKTRDIAWLLSMGYLVVGAELSVLAVAQLFAELGVEPETTRNGALDHCRAPGVEVFVGDFFDLTAEQVGPVDAIYDRAALVAMPEGMRDRYAAHLKEITGTATQLLICFEYDQSQMQGPPFSIVAQEVDRLYSGAYTLRLLERGAAAIRGRAAQEAVWLLA